jgi:hypothetical protein
MPPLGENGVMPQPKVPNMSARKYKSLDLSKAHQRLVDREIQSAKLVQEGGALDQYSQAVRDNEAKASAERSIDMEQTDLEERLSADLPKSRKNRDLNRRMRAESEAAGLVDELCLVLDAFLLDVIDHHSVRAISGPLHLAVTNILQAAQTTAYAVTLLLKYGYVVDADARWRGLYELTCQAAVLSQASDPEMAALRYLMHGEKELAENRLKSSDLSRGKAVVQQELLRGPGTNPQTNQPSVPFWERDYQWIPAELLQGGAPQKRITQKDIFAIANLEVAPSRFVEDSHKSVHMSSLSVATESTVALDNDPGGYSAALEEEIAERTALTLYELVAHCCVLAEKLPSENSYAAWAQAFHERVRFTVEGLN